MSRDIRNMFRIIVLFNLITFVTSSSLIMMLDVKYIIPLTLGLSTATLNLYLRSVVLNYLLINGRPVNSLINNIAYLIRIGSTAIIGLIIFTYNKYSLLVYMGGYILHFVGVMLYALKLNRAEGK